MWTSSTTVNNIVEKENKISDRFREVRKLLGNITQQELADRLFLSRNYIAKIESDAQEPSARVLRDLEALRVDYEHTPSTSTSYAEDYAVEHSPSEAVELRRAQIRQKCEDSIALAGSDLGRLSWLLEQVRAHLRAPDHWRSRKSSAHSDAQEVAKAKQLLAAAKTQIAQQRSAGTHEPRSHAS